MSVLLEIIEWVDPTGNEMIYRIPQEGSADFKLGAQLIVRDSQLAIFFKDGHAADSFSTGRHTLTSLNIPILTRLLAFPFGFNSPFRAEVYFVNFKTFVDQKWGTQRPVAFRDDKLGLIRLRAHGAYTMRIVEPLLFLNTLVGRQSIYTTADVQGYLRDVIVARMNDMLGEKLKSILDLPSQYTELAAEFKNIVETEFSKYGLQLIDFYINAITPPDDVSKMIDKRSGMEAVGDIDKYLKFEIAKGFGSGPQASGAGMTMGAGVGVMMPTLLNKVFAPEQSELRREPIPTITCPKCHTDTPEQSRYCYRCGNQMVAQNICPGCQQQLPTEAKFCHHCGTKLNQKTVCPHCSAQLISGSKFCGDCGKAIDSNG